MSFVIIFGNICSGSNSASCEVATESISVALRSDKAEATELALLRCAILGEANGEGICSNGASRGAPNVLEIVDLTDCGVLKATAEDARRSLRSGEGEGVGSGIAVTEAMDERRCGEKYDMDGGVCGTKRRFGGESTTGGACKLLLYCVVCVASFVVRRQLRVLVRDDAEGEASLIVCVAGLRAFALALD